MSERARVILGDCLDVLKTLELGSVEAVVTDPPYGLAFMGKDWDHGVPGPHFWELALAVAKPGAHLLAFGGTRTFHRLTCAIEDAGWGVRDCLMWLYGSGFPKSLDVSKAIDKAAGAKREAVGRRVYAGGHVQNSSPDKLAPPIGTFVRAQDRRDESAPATDLARQWDGWGTALKPAWEPIILARKPLVGTVAANVAAHGTGALNVDGCRIDVDPNADAGQIRTMKRSRRNADDGWGMSTVHGDRPQVVRPEGRWPANVVLDEEAAALLDERSGDGPPSERKARTGNSKSGWGLADNGEPFGYSDTGGASRFFYCAKASRAEREAGLDGLPPQRAGVMQDDAYEWPGTAEHSPHHTPPARNHHPTVKPVALMRWLCRLVTPPGGLVLDPFTGSGTTGVAAVHEGFRFLGIEREADYVAIAERRIRDAEAQIPLGLVTP